MDSSCQLACMLNDLAIGSLPQFSPLSRLVGYFCRSGLECVRIVVYPVIYGNRSTDRPTVGGSAIASTPPQNPKTGQRANDHHSIINAFLWILHTGAPRRVLPIE